MRRNNCGKVWEELYPYCLRYVISNLTKFIIHSLVKAKGEILSARALFYDFIFSLELGVTNYKNIHNNKN